MTERGFIKPDPDHLAALALSGALPSEQAEKVLQDAGVLPHRYSCHNKPRPTKDSSYVAQAGWVDMRDGLGTPIRAPVLRDIKSAFGTTTCQYDKSQTDPACFGCHQQKGRLA